MKEISLTQGYFTQVDDKDYDFLMSWNWHAKINVRADGSVCVYARRKGRKFEGEVGGSVHYMHHTLIGHPELGFETDHKDGNALNNQRYNIHNVTKRQNQQNRSGSNPSSQYPGVSWDKYVEKWQVRIQIDEKRKNLGHFDDEFEAAQAYKAVLESIGEIFAEGSIGSYL